LDYRNDNAPFTDIRVRQAIQEAIDLPTIAKTYYGGIVEGVPVGIVPTTWTGWYVPYAQWPQAVKDSYTYNPTAAKQLLAAAGYPTGFNTDVVAPSNYDLDLLQIYKSYLAAIGINMTINVTDYTSWLNAYLITGKQDQILYNQSIGYLQPPSRLIAHFYSKSPPSSNACFVKDPKFDAIYNNFQLASDPAQQRTLLQQADMYGITNFFHLNALPTVEYVLYQPWFKGFQGQLFYFWAKMSLARYWIDQPLKQSMGQ
jgi:peptide/nickel transport system substrate-binding protein